MKSIVWLCLVAVVAIAGTNQVSANITKISHQRSPNDFIVGAPISQSVLLYSERVLELHRNETTFQWIGPIINRIEALDQTSGTGGHVWDMSGGISYNHVRIMFASWGARNTAIHFVVNIYGSAGTDKGNDLINGELNERSYLVHTERVQSRQFSWVSSSVVSRLEILDQSNGTAGMHRIALSGGVSQRFVRFDIIVASPTATTDYLVKIYTEPQDFVMGFDAPDSVMVLSQRVRSNNGHALFHWTSPMPITKLVALDQTNGTGGFVGFGAGVQSTNVYLEFVTMEPRDRIDFIVNVFAALPTANDLTIGNRTASSVRFFTQQLTDDNVGDRFWSYRSDDTITEVELLDGTGGTGARIEFHAVVANDINLWFTATGVLNFTLTVYGERLNVSETSPNDIVLGERTPHNFIVDRVSVDEQRWSVATYVFESEHRLTRIEIMDQSRGRGGQARIVHGGIGHRQLVVLFTSDEQRRQSIRFDVTVYAG